MALRNKLLSLLALLSYSLAFADLVEVASKQSLPELRYSSADGKIIYYQNHSGELLFATNYKVKRVLKSEAVRNTQYQVYLSPSKNYAVISQNENMHNFLSMRKELKLYLLKVGETTPSFLGTGVAPQLQLNDSWVSYYQSISKKIIVKGIENTNREYQIQLANKVNPYFIPQVVMPSSKSILFTDLNNEGIMGVLEYQIDTGKITPILKGTSPLERIEMCANDTQLYIGLFGLNKSNLGSAITGHELQGQTFADRQIIYESTKNDLGNMKCQQSNKLFFIKNESNDPQTLEQFSIAELSFDLKQQNKAKIELLTTPDSHVQLVEMDGKIFVESLGKYFLLSGENNLGKDQWLKK